MKTEAIESKKVRQSAKASSKQRHKCDLKLEEMGEKLEKLAKLRWQGIALDSVTLTIFTV